MTAITSEAFARQLAALGIITADLGTVDRITITAVQRWLDQLAGDPR